MKRSLFILGALFASLVFIAFIAGCPQQATDSNTITKPLPKGEAAKPITTADIDMAGNDDKELKGIAAKVLDKDGSIVASERLTEKEWDKLKTQLSGKVKTDPKPFTYYLLAGVENAMGAGSAEALAAAQEAVKLAPESAWANDILGQVLLMGGRDDEANAAFEKAKTLSAKGVQPPYATAKTGGRDDEVMSGGRDDEVAGSGGRDDEVGESKLVAELGTGPMRYANYAPDIKLAIEPGNTAKYDAAKLGLKGAEDKELAEIAAKILTPQGYFYRDAAIAEADWKALMDKLVAKTKAGDNALAAWLYAGAMLVDKDIVESPTLKKVIVQADKAAGLQPESPRALYMQGVTLALSGASDKAIKALAKAAKLDPAFAAPHLALADVYARMGNMDLAKAELNAVGKIKGASKAEISGAEAKLKALAAKEK